MLAFFAFDVFISFFEAASKKECFRYFFEKVEIVEVTSIRISKENVLNYVDVVFVIVLCVAIGDTCTASSYDFGPILGLLRVSKLLMYMMKFKQVKRVVFATGNCFEQVKPQLRLFLVVFYGFAQVGMGLFAGCVTEVTSDGGPGDWSTQPWSSTAFGGAPFYYSNLNFDNLHSAFSTLFMLMIQNNWCNAAS